MTFDREAFERERASFLVEQAQDSDLHRLGLDFVVKSDRYSYAYQWTWCGLPIIQLPQDILAMQQLIWRNRPSVIVETGVAWGGGLALYASLMELYGGRLVIGVDLNLAESVETDIANLPVATPINLFRGSSTDPGILATVKEMLQPEDSVMVVLDSNHTHDHVLAELGAYQDVVSVGQYLIVSDTIVEFIPTQTHRPRAWGPGNNPKTAVDAFLASTDSFVVDAKVDSQLVISFSPSGYLLRVR